MTIDRQALQSTIRGDTNGIMAAISIAIGPPKSLMKPFASRLEKDLSLRSVLNETISSGATVEFTRV
jgi:hypothetical protein|tara:strand:- start:768 stop:968 length:201 start_codon:yes stop_codon:yes gene_type:complete